MNSIQELKKFGQSIWFDNINRRMLDSGELKKMIGMGLLGMTSNPTIFDKAISGSADYDGAIQKLGKRPVFEIYDELTVKDVQDAADNFRPVFDKTEGLDGYVSLEVNPHLAHKTKESINEALRLHKKVNRPNIMFKIPSTPEGFPVVKALISQGINVNVTLIFSVGQYINTATAFVEGLEQLKKNGGDVKKVASVASVFVSRIDTLTDKLIDEKLKEKADPKLKALKGKAAVANSKLLYQEYLKIFSSSNWKELAKAGARVQRVLWASTSTKNPSYSDVKYVAELIGRDTVNTLPDNTWAAFLDHGRPKEVISTGIKESKQAVSGLKKYGIDINGVCAKLLADGVVAFEKSFDSLLKSIEKKAAS